MEEERPSVQVREWAKLKLVGQPLLTGRGLWVALRPLPGLVHIYYDSDLRELLRFPQDPIFLLLLPHQENTPGWEHVEGSTSEPMFTSLLVITSDRRLWWIPQISSHGLAHRPAKKMKQSHSKEGTEDKWDLFEDCDIYKDTDLYLDHDVHASSESALVRSSKTHILCKVSNIRTCENASRRVQVESVLMKSSIGKFRDACLAVAGPNKLIAVMSSSRSPIILDRANLSLTDFASTSSIDCYFKRETRPSCLVFATMKSSRHRPQLDGLNISPNFFNALGRGFVGVRPKHLLLQGNTSGEVHIFAVDYRNHISSPMLLCDLQEPISEVIAFPLCEVSDALLVISSHGYLIVINASPTEDESTPFLTSITEPSVQRLFRIDLRDMLTVRSWRVKAPVVSVTVYKSDQLCFHLASSMYIVSLLEKVNPEPSQISSYSSSTSKTSEVFAMKKSLTCKNLPLFDVVVAVTEGGPVVPGANIGSLVALTSRGRLVALSISDNVLKAQTDCFILTENAKSWKPTSKNRDGGVMVLLDEIAATESCTKALEAMKMSIDCALSELAIALRLAYDIFSHRHEESLWVPHQSLAMPLITSLLCNLEVKPVVPNLHSKRLCFRPARNHNVHPCIAENISSLRLNLKVTLSNHGSYPVSPYWILLLDVHVLEEQSMNKMYFSGVINDGYGLAPHTSSAMVFEIPYAGNTLEVHVFLCHIHEHHDELLQTSSFSNIRTFEIDSKSCDQNIAKYLRQPMEAISGKNKSTLQADSKAACILLSKYRVDVLSLLKPPQQLHHSLNFHCSEPQSTGVGHASRSFLAKFQLNFRRVGDPSLTSEERWKEIGLDDVMKCSVLSKDGRELSGADVYGNSVLLALNNKQLGGQDLLTTEILISASCPMMGSKVREAVLGRLKQQVRGWKMLEADIRGPFQNMDQVLNVLMDVEQGLDLLEQDAENIGNLWHASDLKHSDLVGQVWSIFERVVEMYMDYREHDASNTFWGFVSQV